MALEDARRLSLSLLLLAFMALALGAFWSYRTPVGPNSDRYDYAARAFQSSQGEGLSPLMAYPLRMSFPGAESWPPENLTRPPLWPVLLHLGIQLGIDDRSGVILASVCAALLLAWLALVGNQSFGGGAGGMAAVCFATSFTTVGALWGGGPEMALAFITFVLWTWIPRGGGRVAFLACGTLYGLLPLLHPVGWVLALAVLLARPRRYERRGLLWIAVGALAMTVPWHLRLWMITGQPLGALQSFAELARNLEDPGGLGPYRGLEARPTWEVLSESWWPILRLAIHRLKIDLLHLDGWLAWPMVALAIYGALRELRLALRDAALIVAVFVLLVPWSAEMRLLLPLLPVACTWTGAGLARLADRRPRFPWALPVALVAAAPWFVTLGAATSPVQHAASIPYILSNPPAGAVEMMRSAGDPLDPVVTESGVLSWRARRGAIFLPDSPRTLEVLRNKAPLRGVEILALGHGTESAWTRGAQAQWDSLFALCEPLLHHRDGPVILRLPPVQSPSKPDRGSERP